MFPFSEKEKAAAELRISPIFFFVLSVLSIAEKKCLIRKLTS